MKRFMFAAFALITLASCDVTVVDEPRYDPRDQVVGSYSMEEYSETYDDYTYYKVYINKDGNADNRIYLENFYGADLRVRAYLNNNRITIPYQVINDYEIEGVGTVDRSGVSLQYSVRDLYENTITDYCQTYGDYH
jgi:hypothetical protein